MTDKLTPATARALEPGGILYDEHVSGLELHANALSKSWRLYYRFAGKQHRPTIGRFPEMPLSTAREVAKAWKMRIAKGENPSAARQALRDAPTVADLCEQYLAEYMPHHKGWREQIADPQRINAAILPGLGSKLVAEVTTTHVDRFLADVRERKFTFAKMHRQVKRGEISAEALEAERQRRPQAKWQANRIRALLSRLFSLAETDSFGKMRPRDSNPVTDAARNTLLKRKRRLEPEELGRLAEALDRYAQTRPTHVACLWCLLLTGARVGEILHAKTHELVGNRLTLTDHKTVDTIGAKTIFIPRRALRILERTPAGTDYLFGNIDLRRAWRNLCADANLVGLQLRDARRTFASYAVDLGVSLDQVGDLYGHTDTRTTKGYSYMLDEAKAGTTERIAEHVWRTARATAKAPLQLSGRFRLRRRGAIARRQPQVQPSPPSSWR